MNKLITPEQAAKDLLKAINKGAETLPPEKRDEFYRAVANGLQSSIGMFPVRRIYAPSTSTHH